MGMSKGKMKDKFIEHIRCWVRINALMKVKLQKPTAAIAKERFMDNCIAGQLYVPLKKGDIKRFHIKLGGHLEIHSNIPAGKGLASSSADITAEIRAISDSYSLPLTNEMISTISAKVEPTDWNLS